MPKQRVVNIKCPEDIMNQVLEFLEEKAIEKRWEFDSNYNEYQDGTRQIKIDHGDEDL